MNRTVHRGTIIAHHLVMMGYGHWLGNDLRGSGSTELRQEKFADLGPIHFGRKKEQPSRQELREFHREAEELLEHEIIWFDQRMRIVIADALGRVIGKHGYTCWAGAVLQNHAHDLLRVHRDPGDLMWEHLMFASRDALRAEGLVPKDHPVWSDRPYIVFKSTVPSVVKCVSYIEDNPKKHGLRRQIYPWVTPYNGWPFHKKR